jgi:hypothetical protein
VKQRVPQILLDIDPLRRFLEHEKWRRTRYSAAKNCTRKIAAADEMIKKLDNIEQWVRKRITDEEWKGLIG